MTGTEGTTATETTFTWTLPALRWLESPTPSDEVTLSSSQEAELREGIANLKIDNNVSFITGTITRGSIGPTSWVSGSTPKLVGAASQNTIEAEMQCSVIGEVCGICTVTNPDNPVNYNQVLLGLNEDNKIAPSSCENYTDPT